MTVIYKSERTGTEIKLVHKQFFNLYDLVSKHLEDKENQTPSRGFKVP